MQAEQQGNIDQSIAKYRGVLQIPSDQRVYAAYAQFRINQLFQLKEISPPQAGRWKASRKTMRTIAISWQPTWQKSTQRTSFTPRNAPSRSADPCTVTAKPELRLEQMDGEFRTKYNPPEAAKCSC